MPNIINIDNAIKNTAMFNVLIEPISEIIDDRTERFQKEDVLKYIFVTKKSERAQEVIKSTTDMTNFKLSQDMGAPEIDSVRDGFEKYISHQTFKKAYVISKEAVEDNQMETITPKTIGFVNAYYRTRNDFGFTILAGGLTGTANIDGSTFKVGTMDTVDGTADAAKQILFTKNHYPIEGGDYTSLQSNKFYKVIATAADRTPEAYLDIVDQVDEYMRKFKNDNGHTLTISPNVIMLPHYAKDVNLMKRALGSQYREGMGDNSVNPLYGKYELVISTSLADYVGFGRTDHAFLMIDTNYNGDFIGGVWYDRIPLEISMNYDTTNKAMVVDGRARFSANFVNWRYIAYVTIPEADLANVQDLPNNVVNSKAESTLLT